MTHIKKVLAKVPAAEDLTEGMKALREFNEAPCSTIWLEDDDCHKARERLVNDKDVQKELQGYKLEKPETLYRGLSWLDEWDFRGDMVSVQEVEDEDEVTMPKIGDTFEGTAFKGVISWTKNLNIAKSFARNKSFGIVVKATVEPDQTLIDLTRLPEELCAENKIRLARKEQEVLTLTYPIYGEVIWIYNKEKGKK